MTTDLHQAHIRAFEAARSDISPNFARWLHQECVDHYEAIVQADEREKARTRLLPERGVA